MAQEHLQKNLEGLTEGEVRRGGVMRQRRQHSPEHKHKAEPPVLGEGQGAQAMQGNKIPRKVIDF